MRKGISPLIASVLLIAFTMSVALVAGPFFSNTLKDVQTSTSNRTNTLAEASNMRVTLSSVRYNRTSRNLEVYVQNNGGQNITNLTVTLLGDSPRQEKFTQEIGVRRIASVPVKVDKPINLEEVQVSLDNYPVKHESRIKCVPEKGLVGYWSMNNEQTNGGTLEDLSKYDNSGTLDGSIETGQYGLLGEAYSFDKSGGRIEVTNPYNLPVDDESWTVNFWITPGSGMQGGGRNGWVVWRGSGPEDTLLSIGAEDNNWEVAHWSNDWNSGVNLFFNKPQFISLHYNSSVPDGSIDQRLYADGKLSASREVGNLSLKNETFYIGARENYNGPMEGLLDEVRIYNRSLSEEEIQRLYSVRDEDLAVKGCALVN